MRFKDNKRMEIYDEYISNKEYTELLQMAKDELRNKFDSKMCKNKGKLFSIYMCDSCLDMNNFRLMASSLPYAQNPDMVFVITEMVGEVELELNKLLMDYNCYLEILPTEGTNMEYRVSRK